MSVKTILAEVDSLLPLTDSIMQVTLRPEIFVDYKAGQYVQVLQGDEALCYSIANAPFGDHTYVLHIRHDKANPYNHPVLAACNKDNQLSLRLPYGRCTLEALEPLRPILFIAGGTGFAPVHAMIEQLLASDDSRKFELFWGVRSKQDLYFAKDMQSWQNTAQSFTCYFLASDENKETLIASILEKRAKDLRDWQVVLGGPFDMVYSIRDALVAHGALPKQLFSDAFDLLS